MDTALAQNFVLVCCSLVVEYAFCFTLCSVERSIRAADDDFYVGAQADAPLGRDGKVMENGSGERKIMGRDSHTHLRITYVSHEKHHHQLSITNRECRNVCLAIANG